MDDKNKGLADSQEGDFILNESGTSVTIDKPDSTVAGDFVESKPKTYDEEAGDHKPHEDTEELSSTEDI